MITKSKNKNTKQTKIILKQKKNNTKTKKKQY